VLATPASIKFRFPRKEIIVFSPLSMMSIE
jgi:hypothetical protein